MKVTDLVRGHTVHYLWLVLITQMEVILPGGHETLMTLLASDKRSHVTSLGFSNCAWKLPGQPAVAAGLKSTLSKKSRVYCPLLPCPTAASQHSKYNPCPTASSAHCTHPLTLPS